jgi:hypothetical protein
MNHIDFRYSKDGGRNWSDWRQLEIGETGEFCMEVVTRQLGIGRQWVFDIRLTDPVRADILFAAAKLEGADS